MMNSETSGTKGSGKRLADVNYSILWTRLLPLLCMGPCVTVLRGTGWLSNEKLLLRSGKVHIQIHSFLVSCSLP